MPDAQGRPLRADLVDVKPTILSNVSYDTLNNIVTVVFPAAVTLYAGLAVLWDWPFSEQIIASAGLIIVFLGLLLKVASGRYQKLAAAEAAAGIPVGGFDGQVIVNHTDPLKDTFRTVVDVPWDELAEKPKITLEVVEEGVTRENHGL